MTILPNPPDLSVGIFLLGDGGSDQGVGVLVLHSLSIVAESAQRFWWARHQHSSINIGIRLSSYSLFPAMRYFQDRDPSTTVWKGSQLSRVTPEWARTVISPTT